MYGARVGRGQLAAGCCYSASVNMLLFFSMFGVVNCHVVDGVILFISRPSCSSDWMLIVEANIVDL